jgi:peptide/nickel transport system permease protein|tara:strand:- start:1510 stop:2526 length:1017 start_codon:yes stop_codon:yes gene_type:complete
MIRTILQRLFLMCLILIGVMTVTFILSRVLPGSPVELMLGAKPTAQQIAEAEEALGLNKPLYQQYFIFLGNAFQGDFGTSLITGQPVTEDVFLRVTATFELVTIALLLALSAGIPLGIKAAVKKEQLLDHSVRIGSVAAVAVPVFFLGLTLQILFAGKLGWLPLQGRIDDAILLDAPFRSITGFYLLDSILSGNFTAFSSAVRHLILPVMTLALASMATIIRITRSMMIEALQQDYIRSARAYGIPQHNIHYLYALKATLIPLLTVVGLTYGFMLGGSIIVEYVFDWPGVGGYMVQALLNQDFTAVMGVTFFVAFAYLIINLIIDLIYQALDPRLKKS